MNNEKLRADMLNHCYVALEGDKTIDDYRQDVMILNGEVEALKAQVNGLVVALELMINTHDEGGWPSATVTIARAALAAYRAAQEVK